MATAQEHAESPRHSSWTFSSGGARILPVLRPIFDALDRAGVRYCHWKSNRNLASALRGETDLDLLVHRGDAARFRSIVERAGFRPTTTSGYPSIANYYGLDEESGKLIDLHVYYRVVTGATIKNYHLPVESMLLDGARRTEDGVYLPARSAELVLFVIRKTLDYAVLSEALRPRQWRANAEELEWLSEGVSGEEVAALLREHLPTIDVALFQRLRDAIRSETPTVRRFLLGRALASRLRPHLRCRAPLALVLRTRHLGKTVWRTLRRERRAATLLSGGAVVGVVGSDASGKSTLVREVSRWLGEFLSVATVHGGKPPPTPVTLAPRALLPLLRRLVPRYRLSRLEADAEEGNAKLEMMPRGRLFILYALRAVMLGYERKRLLVRAHRKAAGGTLVIADRYPTRQPGVPEGPALHFLLEDAHPLYRWLARMEERVYRAIPLPDLILSLNVPLEVAVQRNLTRAKPGGPEPIEYLRRRHAQCSKLDFPGVPLHRIPTDGSLDDTLRSVKTIVWRTL